MGYRLVDYILINNEELRSSQKWVLVALAKHVNEDSWSPFCWPSYDTMARIASLSKRTVITITYQLEELGYIEIETKGGGRRNSNTYKINTQLISDAKYQKNYSLPKTVFPSHHLAESLGIETLSTADILDLKSENNAETVQSKTLNSVQNSPEKIKENIKESINEDCKNNQQSKAIKMTSESPKKSTKPPKEWEKLKHVL